MLSKQEAGIRRYVAIISIFEETVSIVSRFKARDGDDKVCGSKTRALHYACIDSTKGRNFTCISSAVLTLVQ